MDHSTKEKKFTQILILFFLQGFEIDGLDNLPEEGPALIIYYHGVVPIDIYYVMAKCLLEKGRLIHAVGDNFLFRIPGETEGPVHGTYIYSLLKLERMYIMSMDVGMQAFLEYFGSFYFVCFYFSGCYLVVLFGC